MPHLLYPLPTHGNGYQGCFHILVMINSASMNIGVRCMHLFRLEFSQDICPEVGLLNHVVALFVSF